jgi:NTP pyrophosphatase (non-canonical NTP hydrolase)
VNEHSLTFNEYTELAAKTNMCPALAGVDVPVYELLALCGESGEAANKLKKHLRDRATNYFPMDDKLFVVKELGDCLWYIDAAARRMGFTLEEVAEININKLQGRHERGTIQGSGDER